MNTWVRWKIYSQIRINQFMAAVWSKRENSATFCFAPHAEKLKIVGRGKTIGLLELQKNKNHLTISIHGMPNSGTRDAERSV
jgi:hypothetical protein